MKFLDQSNSIRFIYHAMEKYPRDTFSEITQDIYVMSSPLCHGRAKIISDGQPLHDGDVHPGMLRIASPGERVRTIVQSPSQAAVLVIPGSHLRRTFDEEGNRHRSGRSSYIDPLLQPNYQVERICTTLLSAPEFDATHRQLFIDGLGSALLACLLRNNDENSRHRKYAHEGLSDAELDRCIQYAESMMTKRLDLTQWAGVLGMTTTEFARRFQMKTRQAPYTWFMNWRIDRAKQLMHDPELSIAEIALHVGFCSQSHFTEAFRRRTGYSPGRWRAQLSGS